MAQLQRLAIAPAQISAQRIALTAPQQHYLGRVLRLQAGDRFIALNGQQWWLSVLLDGSAAEMLELMPAQTELPVSVTLLIALPKNGMDDVVRQATELGVDQIVPVLSNRTVLKPSPQKCDRWQRIVQEAAEQSERQSIPTVIAPQSWAEALQTWNAASSSCYICAERGDGAERGDRLHLLQALEIKRQTQDLNAAQVGQPLPSLTIATGCEGGWTDQELEQAIAAGYQPVSLGSRILRAVTAPLVALSLVASVFEAMPHPNKTV
ncbi:MAG TPA: 16S rRNA (uracil(1498)-N(3))-methyltransferase [Coleofasciculaceae cyanobacterium]